MATVKRRKKKLSDGTVKEEGWQVRYVDPSGAERSKTFTRQRDAQRFANDVESAKNRGVYVDLATRGRVTFKEFAEEWRGLQTWRPATAGAHEWRLTKHVYPVLGGMRMAGITTFDVQRMVKKMSETESSASTVRDVASTTRAVFLAAMRQKVIAESPMAGVKLPALDDGEDEGEVVALTPEQFRAFEAALPKRFRVAAWIGLGTGLRVGEVCGLTEDRITFLASKRSVTVNRQMLPSGQFGPPKTRASRRKVPVAESLIAKISAHLAEFPDPDRERRLVITAERGGQGRDALLDAVTVAARAAGLSDKQRFHSLRHTYASMLLSSGLSIKVAQKYLGHSKAQETLDTYGHMLPQDEDRALIVIEEGVSSFLIGPESDLDAAATDESPGQTR